MSAQTLLKLMDSFATKAGMVRADTTRNLLLIQGSGAERRTAVDTALSFDVDWMRGQSVGIFPIVNSGPEPVIAELEKIVDSGENGLSQNVIKFQAVSRLNAILVVSQEARTAAYRRDLDQAARSMRTARRTSVHVYRVKYGEARQIARVLTDMFGGGSSSGSLLDSADNQIAPGSGTSASASGDRLSLNTNNPSSSSGRLWLPRPVRNRYRLGTIGLWRRKRRQRRRRKHIRAPHRSTAAAQARPAAVSR